MSMIGWKGRRSVSGASCAKTFPYGGYEWQTKIKLELVMIKHGLFINVRQNQATKYIAHQPTWIS